jgi:CRISPR-associated protein Csb1
VIAEGGIRRDATLSLAALRLLSSGKDAAKTLALRRYILGLALTAFTQLPAGYLRQGCMLVSDPDRPREFLEVSADGVRKPVKLKHDDALKFAESAARAFGVGENREVAFDRDLAKKDVGRDGDGEPGVKQPAKKTR